MKKLSWAPIALLLAGSVFAACEKKNGDDPTTPAPRKGAVTGTITNANGEPLAGVQVYASHHTYYNTNVLGKTDAKGNYVLNLNGQPAGTWNIAGELVKTYNGQTYTFQIDPANTDPVTTTEGGVRNMKWTLTGVIPGSIDDSRIGGYITFFIMADDYIPAEEIEFTLEPVGQLVDGSTGRKIVQRAAMFPVTMNGLYNTQGLRDVPVGRYKITALHKPASGTATPVMIARKGGAYGTEVIADFKQEAPYRFQEIDLDLTLQQ